MDLSDILIVEDDAEMALVLRQGFELDRHSVTVANNGGEALKLARQKRFQAIVLDVMLPVLDGYAVASALRGAGDRTPILMLTARDSVADIVRGFDCGVEDYLTKPFSFLELSARVRALIRRGQPYLLRSEWQTLQWIRPLFPCRAVEALFALRELSFVCSKSS